MPSTLFFDEFQWRALRARAAEAEGKEESHVTTLDIGTYVNSLAIDDVRDDATALRVRAGKGGVR